MNYKRLYCLLFVFVGLISLIAKTPAQTGAKKPGSADVFAAQHQKALARNPKGVVFSLATANNQTKFQMGEVLRVELSFTSSIPDTYGIDAHEEARFIIDKPDGVAVPRDDEGDLLISVGATTPRNPALGVRPVRDSEEITEDWRFVKPGKYRLYAISRRVHQGLESDWESKLTIVSNIVEFEITPTDPKWAETTLQDALKIIDDKAVYYEKRQASCNVVRQLGTEAAAREMVSRFTDDDVFCVSQYQSGLQHSQHRSLVVKLMEQKIDDPKFPVTERFLRVLAYNAFILSKPAPLPPRPSFDSPKADEWQELKKARDAARRRFERKYQERLLIALKNKEDEPLAITLGDLLEAPDDDDETLETGLDLSGLAERLAGIFFKLPPNKQHSLLDYNWERIASPAMLPVLRKLYETPTATSFGDTRSEALKRLYQLAPEEGRQIILNELRRPDPRIDLEILQLLPDDDLPELDQTLTQRLFDYEKQTNQAYAAALFERYASPAMLPVIQSAYGEKLATLDCFTQASLLRYFLRNDAEYGWKMVERNLAEPGGGRCGGRILTEAAGVIPGPEFERIALAYLNDQDLAFAAGSAKALGKYGAAAIEDKLWQRMEALRQEWQGRRQEIEKVRKPYERHPVVALELGLVEALGYAPAWLLSGEKAQRLQQLCLSAECRQKTSLLRHYTNWERVDFYANLDEGTFTVEQYSDLTWEQFKTKAAQYPRGTLFSWAMRQNISPKEARIFSEAKNYLTQSGMRLERAKILR